MMTSVQVVETSVKQSLRIKNPAGKMLTDVRGSDDLNKEETIKP